MRTNEESLRERLGPLNSSTDSWWTIYFHDKNWGIACDNHQRGREATGLPETYQKLQQGVERTQQALFWRIAFSPIQLNVRRLTIGQQHEQQHQFTAGWQQPAMSYTYRHRTHGGSGGVLASHCARRGRHGTRIASNVTISLLSSQLQVPVGGGIAL